MESYADDLPNTNTVEKVVKKESNFIIEQVQREVTGKTNDINRNLKYLSGRVEKLEKKVDANKESTNWTMGLIVVLQLAIIILVLLESISQIKP